MLVRLLTYPLSDIQDFHTSFTVREKTVETPQKTMNHKHSKTTTLLS